MAFTATTEWDVRTTGSDSNGGAFDTASTGTDYSQRDTPQVSYTDLVIGSTNTQLTSAANPFGSTHVGNIINVTGGTGFTVQRVQIVSVAGAVATCDKACGTASSTGGTGNLGGALLGIQTAVNLAVANNRIHVKAGTYTFTTSLAMPSTSNIHLFLAGYQTTHLDMGTKPLITTSTNSLDPLIKTQFATGYLFFQNFQFTNTATTPLSCFCQFVTHWTTGGLTLDRCKASGFTSILNTDNNGSHFNTYNYWIFNSEFSGSQQLISVSISAVTNVNLWGCYIHDMTTTGAGDVIGPNNLIWTVIERCIFANSASGKYFLNCVGTTGNPQLQISNSVFYKSGGSAINFVSGIGPQTVRMENCVFYGSTSYDLFATGQMPPSHAQDLQWKVMMKNNAFGGSGSGRTPASGVTAGEGDITLTADPFTNGTGGDFSLNSAAGGGALLKAAGFGNTLPGVANAAGKLDLGAVQSGSTAGTPLTLRPSPIIRPM